MWNVKSKVVAAINCGNWNILTILRKVLAQHAGRARLARNSHTGHCTHTSESTNVIVQNFFVNKPNRCTEFQFYWYYDSTCSGQSFCPSSVVLSRTSALVKFVLFGDRVLPGAGWRSILRLEAPGH
jgi:hypothetical protein